MKIENSSNILGIDFDEDKKILTVEFSDGAKYEYSGVEKAIFEHFENTNAKGGSVGRLFHSKVKGKYQFRKITEDEEIIFTVEIPNTYKHRV